jgi:hypothetical protein
MLQQAIWKASYRIVKFVFMLYSLMYCSQFFVLNICFLVPVFCWLSGLVNLSKGPTNLDTPF